MYGGGDASGFGRTTTTTTTTTTSNRRLNCRRHISCCLCAFIKSPFGVEVIIDAFARSEWFVLNALVVHTTLKPSLCNIHKCQPLKSPTACDGHCVHPLCFVSRLVPFLYQAHNNFQAFMTLGSPEASNGIYVPGIYLYHSVWKQNCSTRGRFL